MWPKEEAWLLRVESILLMVQIVFGTLMDTTNILDDDLTFMEQLMGILGL